MEVTTFIGFAGGLAVLASFAAAASGRTSAHSPAQHATNLAGALAMVAAAFPAAAWPSVAVNVAWALISSRGLACAIASRRPLREPRADEHPAPAV